MAIKPGSTATICISLPGVALRLVDNIIFTFKSEKYDREPLLQKTYPDEVTAVDNTLYICLTQEETLLMQSQNVYLEGQVNYSDKSVVKTYISKYYVDSTLATQLVDGNKANPAVAECVEMTAETALYLNASIEMIEQSVEACKNAKEVSEEAIAAKDEAVIAADNAKQSEENAKKSETEAGNSKTITEQAMKDLLAMLGNKIATLTEDGKLTPSQIPNLSIINSFEVQSVDELVTLDAQMGDMGYIKTDGKVTDVYWLAGEDASVAENWLEFGVSFVQEAGNAQTAVEAENAQKINGHRLVEMAAEEFEAAVKDDNTYYLVY